MSTIRNVLVCSLAASLLAIPVSVLAADRNEAKAREASRLEKAIKNNQKLLETLNRDEMTLKRQVENLDKRLPGARERLESLEKEVAVAKTALSESQKARQQSEKVFQDAKDKFEAITKSVEGTQSETSPFGVARAEYLAAKEALGQTVDKIEDSPEYKQAYERAKASRERLQALPEVRKQFIDKNPKIIEAQADLAGKKSRYEALRVSVLGKDPSWAAASKAFDEAKAHDTETDQKGKEAVVRNAKAANQFTATQKEVKQLEGDLAKANSVLSGIPGRKSALQGEIERDRRARSQIRF